MFHRTLICGLLGGVALIGLPGMTHASHHASSAPVSSASAPVVGPGCAPAPIVTTVTVYEQVPETYTATRTVYKSELVTESYTAYKYETVQEPKTVTKYVPKTIKEVKEVVVSKWVCVPTVEHKTVTKKVPVCKTVTEMQRKCVDQGCYKETCEETLVSRLKGHFHGCGHCPDYRTKKVWVPNKVWVETPVTKTVRSWECVTETVAVTVNKKVCVQEKQNVETCRVVCEPVTETVMVSVSKCVPYAATRQVSKCVPVTETYTATRYVCKPVQKQVVSNPAPCSESRSLFSGLFSGGFGGLFKGCGCGKAAPDCGGCK